VEPLDKHGIILFDGVCNLCNGAVTFIIDRDPAAYFRFAPLQSEVAQRLLPRGIDTSMSLSSLILIEGNRFYTHSTAALRIARKLRGGWPLLYGFMIVPKVLRDSIYSWVATNRYRWFGTRETCRVPTEELRSRFL
jgi:predicted DCC family thiol-disulfide oxidoreductase YuxK